MLFLNFILYLIGSSKYIVVLTRSGLNRILCYLYNFHLIQILFLSNNFNY